MHQMLWTKGEQTYSTSRGNVLVVSIATPEESLLNTELYVSSVMQSWTCLLYA